MHLVDRGHQLALTGRQGLRRLFRTLALLVGLQPRSLNLLLHETEILLDTLQLLADLLVGQVFCLKLLPVAFRELLLDLILQLLLPGVKRLRAACKLFLASR